MRVRSLAWQTDVALARLGGAVVTDQEEAVWGAPRPLRRSGGAASCSCLGSPCAEVEAGLLPDTEHVAIGMEATQDAAGYDEFARGNRDQRPRLVAGGQAQWFGAFEGEALRARLGIVDAGGGLARYQSVETHPSARRRGLAGTLVQVAAVDGPQELKAGRLVIVAEPEHVAIRRYRAMGFQDHRVQLQLIRRPMPSST